MAYPDELLVHARELASSDARRPKRSNLRRAISAAYYAVFHEIVEHATRAVLSAQHAVGPIGIRMRRVVEHQAIKSAASELLKPPGQMSAFIRKMRGHEHAVSPESLARAFRYVITLQEQRHRADYDLAIRVYRDEAIRYIEMAELVIAELRGLSNGGDKLVFLLIALFGSNKLGHNA